MKLCRVGRRYLRSRETSLKSMNRATSLPPGSRVLLESFCGQKQTTAATRPNENYWLLVGERGTVVESPNGPYTGGGETRVLVQFDKSVKSLGLECHNSVENALWVLVSDLSREQ